MPGNDRHTQTRPLRPTDIPSDEADALANMIAGVDRRVDELTADIPNQIEDAVRSLRDGLLSDEERIWVKLAIKREGQSIALRQAVIEKSLTGLVWAALGALAYMVKEWATNHGYKP